MKNQSTLNKKGVTLVELLVALVIAAITLAGIYRVFISQTKTYAVQDQVVEVQQSVRTAMDILLRDLEMTGFDDDTPKSDKAATPVKISKAIGTTLSGLFDNRITLNYEYYVEPSGPYQKHTVVYWVDANSNLWRKRIINDSATHFSSAAPYTICHTPATSDQCPEIILTNVAALIFAYGVDRNMDGAMDDQNGDGIINALDYITAGAVGTANVVAIRVTLSGGPNPDNPDVAKVVSPRTLVSSVAPRNLCPR